MKKPPDAQNPRGTTPEGSAKSSTPIKVDDSRTGHILEAVIRLEALEGGPARVVLGLQDVDTLPAYIELSRVARRHLAAVA